MKKPRVLKAMVAMVANQANVKRSKMVETPAAALEPSDVQGAVARTGVGRVPEVAERAAEGVRAAVGRGAPKVTVAAAEAEVRTARRPEVEVQVVEAERQKEVVWRVVGQVHVVREAEAVRALAA